MTQRPLPHSLEAEQATLGAMLMERDALRQACELLSAGDFYHDEHRTIFAALAALAADGPADIVTVEARLGPQRLAEVGGERYLLELQEAAPTAAAVATYARIVKGRSRQRAALIAAMNYSEAARRGEGEEAAARPTLAAALAAMEEAAAPAVESWELRDFLARDLPTPAFVVEGLLRGGTLSFLYGPPASGKSFLGVELCRCAVSGRSFLGRFPCVRGAAALIEEESAPSLLRQRLAELEAGEPLPADAEALTVIPLQGLRLDDALSRAALRALLRELGPVVVVIDTLAAVAGGTDLLKVEQVRPLLAYLREVAAELVAAVVILAHSPKWRDKAPALEALYGSVDLGAAADAAFAVCRLPVAGHTFRLAQTKGRWGGESADVSFSLGPGPDGGLVVTGGGREGVAAIVLDVLDGGDWVTSSEVKSAVTAASYSEQAGRKAVSKLQKDGKIEVRGATTTREYRLAEGAES